MIQPHSSAITDKAPETAQARRNHFAWESSRFRHQRKANHAPSAISIVQMPTIVSKAQCNIVFAGGRSSGDTESSPVTFVLVLQPTRNESKPGMPIPPLTPLAVQ